MKTFNKKAIMASAWRLKNGAPHKSFAWALSQAWEIEKELIAEMQLITVRQFQNIITKLKCFRLSFSQSHFHFLGSSYGRRVMKRADNDETKQMLSEGILFFNDIMNRRRRLAASHRFEKKRVRPFRNRIVKLEFCQRIDVDEFIKTMAA